MISNYRGNDSFCDDMTGFAEMIFQPEETYSVKWAARRTSRTPKKQINGNFENLYIYSKV